MSANLPAWLDALRDRLTIHDSRADWLTARKARIAAGGIGSTTASALLSLSPWRNPWDCWAAVHAPELLDDTVTNERLLARGLALEPLADQLYRDDTGAETWGVSEHMTATHPDGVICASPDAFCRHPSAGVGVAEYKIVQPWRKDRYPADVLEVRTLADLDDASTLGRWPVDRQYVVQCMVHLLATGLDYVDLFAVFAQDVRLGHHVEGWDVPIAVDGWSRLRIWRDDDTLAKVGRSIMAAHAEIIEGNREPVAFAPPPPWDDTRDPLSGKREAEAEEVDLLADLSEISARFKTDKAEIAKIRASLRDAIADSGNKGIHAESDTGGRITASVSKIGRLTVRGL